jgi:hypothetical protein
LIAEPVIVRRLGVILALAAAVLTSACAAGQQASTSNEKPTIDGTNISVGSMDLRGLLIESPTGSTPYYPAGSDASVKLVIVNTGQKADQLVSITSPAFSNWGAFATTAQAGAVVDADQSKQAAATAQASSSAAASSPATGSGSATGSASASASGSAATSPSASPTPTQVPLPQPSRSVSINPGSRTSWGTPEAKGTLLLLGTKQVIYPGSTIQLTFTFANAGSVTVAVPIALSTAPHSSVIPAPASSTIEG